MKTEYRKARTEQGELFENYSNNPGKRVTWMRAVTVEIMQESLIKLF